MEYYKKSPNICPEQRVIRPNSPTANQANSGQYSMLIDNAHFSANNMYNFLYYPDTQYPLGDCCAEYVEARDEVICFGGRTNENDTAFAHETPAALVFDSNSNAAQWNYQKYPPMPHPRWSAASVLIKGLGRKGAPEPCDRIFIIGGRNRDGFVPEVDVFNLRYNRWETDWKGLDQGELETYTALGSGSGTTIIVQGGGGDSVQSIKAGEGILITGNSKNPTIAVRVSDFVAQLVQNESFRQAVIQALTENTSLIQNIANTIIANSAFIANITNEVLHNEEVLNRIVNDVVNNAFLIDNIVQNIVNNPALLTNITNEIISSETLVNDIINQVVNSQTLYNQIVDQVFVNQVFITTIAGQIVNNETFVTQITNEILQSNTLVQNIVNQITTSVMLTTIRAEDHCIVGRIENGEGILPIRLVDTEPANPVAGTLYLIKEENAPAP